MHFYFSGHVLDTFVEMFYKRHNKSKLSQSSLHPPDLCPESSRECVVCLCERHSRESRKSGRKEDMTCHLQRLHEDRPTQPSAQ